MPTPREALSGTCAVSCVSVQYKCAPLRLMSRRCRSQKMGRARRKAPRTAKTTAAVKFLSTTLCTMTSGSFGIDDELVELSLDNDSL